MHIPENYLSPSTCAVMIAAATPAIAYCAKKVKATVEKDKMPLLGIFAAFSFVAMMFNIPLPGGTTGHAVGGTLIAILLGPHAACLCVSVTLILQALLFGDGGILALGANIFNIAFVLPFVGYSIFNLLKSKIKSTFGEYFSAAIGSFVGINAAAILTAIEFGIQPYLFKDTAGQALYCPYGLDTAIPSMMIGHLTIFGLAEVLFTVGVYAFVKKAAPTIASNKADSKKGNSFIVALLGALICLSPLGLLATGTAWGEWGVEEMPDLVGFTPAGMSNGVLSSFEAICPDYAIGDIPEVIAYIISAIIGVALCVIIFRLSAIIIKDKKSNE